MIINQDFLRFLWYKTNEFNEKILPCKMTSLSYGLLCAQSAVCFCLEKMLLDNATKASDLTILKAWGGFYLDDGLFSFQSEQ